MKTKYEKWVDEMSTYSSNKKYCIVQDIEYEGLVNNLELLEIMDAKGYDFLNVVFEHWGMIKEECPLLLTLYSSKGKRGIKI